MILPEYKTTAGNLIRLNAISFEYERFYVQNTNEEECRKYAEALSDQGFKLYDENEMPAGDNYVKRTNLAYSFVADDGLVFIFWDASLHTAFVNSTPKTPLPSTEKPESMGGKCTFSQIALENGGMSYVTKFCDGSFLIIDGGKACENDAEKLFDFLKSSAGENGKIRISAWFFTHAHNDHIGLATVFLRKYRSEIEVSAFLHQFPDCDKINVACDMPYEKQVLLDLCSVIEEKYPESTVYYTHTGQRYYFDGATLEVLFSCDNYFPSLFFSLNDTSVVTRIRFDSGKTALLLADATHIISKQLADSFGSYLKSDFLQMAHHGLIGGDIDLYRLIDPDVCLWPVKPKCFDGALEGQKYKWCLGEGGLEYNAWIRDSSVKHREHYDHRKTISFEL